MGGLQIFKNAEFGSVRAITVAGEPYLSAYRIIDDDVSYLVLYLSCGDTPLYIFVFW